MHTRMTMFLMVAILVLSLGAAYAFEGNTLAKYNSDLDGLLMAQATPWEKPLMPAFIAASKEFKVPLPLLLTLAYLGSAFENRGGAPTRDGGYGVMSLKDNVLGGESLAYGATLTGAGVDTLRFDPHANIRAAAAVIAGYGGSLRQRGSQGIDGWLNAVIKYAGLDPEMSKFFAMEVYEKLKSGMSYTNRAGETFSFPAQSIGKVDLQSLRPKSVQDVSVLSTDYGPAIWNPTASCNYNAINCTKDTVVVHTIEGTPAAAFSVFNNCAKDASAHYVIGENGTVWQCVRENYKAWHASCYNTRGIGLEHEGFAGAASHPTSLYRASAALVKEICNERGIPKQHKTYGPGILGHNDANVTCGGTHWDPGPGWDWNYYIGLVNPPAYSVNWPAMARTANNAGYWICHTNGAMYSYGNAAYHGGSNGFTHQPIVDLVQTSDAGGYWQFASDGGVFSYGNAGYYGSMGGQPLNKPITGAAATSNNGGYWLVGEDGGIFCFGNAGFYGSTGGMQLNAPIVAMASTSTNGGYWLVASDGGVFCFGDAGFYGSMGGQPLNAPIVAIARTANNGGYWLVGSDGGIFCFGNAGFYGSMGSTPLAAPIVDVISTSTGNGYWLLGADAGVFCFGDAHFYGHP